MNRSCPAPIGRQTSSSAEPPHSSSESPIFSTADRIQTSGGSSRGYGDAALEHASDQFGLDINRTHDTLDNLFNEGGVYNYNSRADFISDYELNAKLSGVGRFYSTFSQGIGPAAFKFATVDYAAFVQDTWHIQPRVTINWGLRYDLESMPGPQIPNPLEPGRTPSRATRTTGDHASASTGT